MRGRDCRSSGVLGVEPRPIGTNFFCRDVGWREIELATVDIDPGDPDFEVIAQPIPPAGAPTDQGMGLGLEVIVIVGEAGDVDPGRPPGG